MGKKLVWILSEALEERGISITEPAEQTGITKRTIKAYCGNARPGFDMRNLDKICGALDCQPDDVVKVVDG